MFKKSVVYILLITSLALTGMVITQLFWVRDAVQQKSEVFDHRARISLERVVDNLLFMRQEKRSGMTDSNMQRCGMSCRIDHGNIKAVISSRSLDSLIRLEFPDLVPGKDYYYGVYCRKDHRFIMGLAGNYQDRLFSSSLTASLTCLFRSETYNLGIYFPNQQAVVLRNMWLWLVVSLILIVAMVFGFSFSVYSLMRQKKVSEMKADFLNSMTHEFKTPIATISIASEMLQNQTVLGSPEKSFRYAEIIQTENERLKKQVEQVLQMAVIDKGEFTLRKKFFEVHKTLEGLIRSFQLIVKQRKGIIKSDFKATQSGIVADKEHFTNVFSNLIDNAEKYSHCAPHITVSTHDAPGGVLITVEDKGVGIKQENQKEIFKQLYRVNTGPMKNVGGFGLGLFYAKTVVDAHGGSITLESTPKQGSKFSIFFPFNLQDVDLQKQQEEISEDLAG
ncbi:MAG: HAMP domain-containing sensor histidine kinase [Bacteroidota bacterium]